MRSIADRIRAFEEVRDEEFKISFDRRKDRSAFTKARMLKEKLAVLGLTSREICVPFEWEATPFPRRLWDFTQFPQNLVERPRKLSHVHAYLAVDLPESGTVMVDPTWDPALHAAGFPLIVWDGFTSTKPAVKASGVMPAKKQQQIIRMMNYDNPWAWAAVESISGSFVHGLNHWLGQQRQKARSLHA